MSCPVQPGGGIWRGGTEPDDAGPRKGADDETTSVVALTGPSLSDVQEQLLTDRFYLIALFLNSREISHRMAAQLMKSIACAMTRCCALLAVLALVGVAGVAIHKSNHQ